MPPTASSELPPMCCKTLKPRVRSRSHRRKRGSSDEKPNDKEKYWKNLEALELLNYENQKKGMNEGVTKKREIKTQNSA